MEKKMGLVEVKGQALKENGCAASLNLRRRLLSGPFPTPWRSSPAPSLRCSHSLKRQTDDAITHATRGPAWVLLTCRNPTAAAALVVSNWSQRSSVWPLILTWAFYQKAILPMWVDTLAYWQTWCKLITAPRLRVHDPWRKETLYIGRFLSGILKWDCDPESILQRSILPSAGDSGEQDKSALITADSNRKLDLTWV